MFKKTMLAVGALAAFAAPTVASAQLLTDPIPLPKGAKFTATSTNLKTTTPLGELTCEQVVIHLKVTENKTASSQAVSESVSTSGCHLKTTPSNVIDPATITNATADFHIEKAGAGTATATFELDLYESAAKHVANEPFAVCHLESTVPLLAITYVTNADTVHVAGPLAGKAPCPTTGTEIHGDLTLETADGTPITIS